MSPLQVPSLAFFGSTGETVLLALALAPFVVGRPARLDAVGASIDERRQLRWLALCLVTGVGAIAVVQLVRLLGLVDVGDGFLAAVPRAVAWAARACRRGDDGRATRARRRGDRRAQGRRRRRPRVDPRRRRRSRLVRRRRHDGAIVPGAPAPAAPLTVAALFLPVRDRLERDADRWLFGEVGSDARLIDAFGAAAEHAGRAEVLELLVATARRALRVRWARASTTGPSPVVAVAGVGPDELRRPAAPLPARSRAASSSALLECGPKRGGPLSAHDRQLLGALGREAALRLRTVSQADELEARLRQIEQQAAEIAASRARIVEAQDEERRRIERDIHDGVQQDLASLIGKLRLAINQIAIVAGRRHGDDRRRPGRRPPDAGRRAGDRPGHPPGDPRRPGHRAGDRGPGQAAAARGLRRRATRRSPSAASTAGSRAPPTSSRRRRWPTSSSTPTRPR